MGKVSARVDMFAYDSYRQLLGELLEARKKSNPQYSYRKFGKDLGFSAPGYLKDVIEGRKNLGATGVTKIVQGLDLSKKERSYFEILVNLNHCKSDTERVRIVAKMSEVFSSKNTRLITDATSFYLTNRMCAIISTLLRIYREKFCPDPIWIMRRIRIPTTIEEISQALNFLLKNDFIRKEDGQYRNVAVNIESSDEEKSRAIQQAHENVLHESIVALDFPLKDREFANVTVQLASEDMDELKQKIKKFRDEIKLWVNNKSKKSNNHLGISINIQMYPFTTDMKR